jgi:lysophospholipase L1-like esterase
MILAALAAAAGLWSAADCRGALCGARSLAPYFDALAARGSLDGAPPVHILQVGDSHSAGDAISGAWRDALQARYGSGGRGVLPPGDPYWGFIPRGVHIEQSDGWRVEATFGKAAPPLDNAVVFGLSGFRLTSDRSGATIGLTATPPEAFNRLIVCAVTGPGAGAYDLTLGGTAQTVSLAAPAAGVDCHGFIAPGLTTTAVLSTQGAPVTLLSWASFRPGGVAVSNLGVVGAQLRHFARANDGAIAAELSAYAPDLIVLEFGTNEAFGTRFDPEAYEATVRAEIARLKRLSGGTPMLIFGAPDAGTDRRELAHNAVPGPGDPTAAEAATGAWFPPPALSAIRAVQRRAAAAEGVAFWDWGDRMGGPGVAQAWVAATPPLMRRDHVHYTTNGGARVANLLQEDLDQAAAAPGTR